MAEVEEDPTIHNTIMSQFVTFFVQLLNMYIIAYI